MIMTTIQNLASAVVLSGFMWISLLPYRISESQAQDLKAGYAIIGLSLVVAWSGGVAAWIAVWDMNRKGLSVGGKVYRWVVASSVATFAVTVVHLTTARFGSVGR